jgi:endonuclease-3
LALETGLLHGRDSQLRGIQGDRIARVAALIAPLSIRSDAGISEADYNWQAMPDLERVIAVLKRRYGEPKPPPAKGPFQLVLWENACYLLSDQRRAAVFDGLRQQVGFNASAIWNADTAVLLPLARMGGMRPEARVFRWREIARLTLDRFGGDLDNILKEPYDKAKRALQAFPSIGAPGAEKILMFCGVVTGLPVESNGLRLLTRLGYGRSQKSYAATYRSIQEALLDELPRDARAISRAHLLFREHGQTICKNNSPLCHECSVEPLCAYAQNRRSQP